ncbi:MAG: hypothetical protein H9W81_04365 [Enterococcus sp.]|nr:hypothetical protein [Enterococcus sp.]
MYTPEENLDNLIYFAVTNRNWYGNRELSECEEPLASRNYTGAVGVCVDFIKEIFRLKDAFPAQEVIDCACLFIKNKYGIEKQIQVSPWDADAYNIHSRRLTTMAQLFTHAVQLSTLRQCSLTP